MTLVPSRRDMPSASRRAVTSAEEPAGNRTVISTKPPGGSAGSCAVAAVARPRSAQTEIAAILNCFMAFRSIVLEDFGDLHAAALARRADPGPDDGERSGGVFAADLRSAVPAHRGGELLELLRDRVVGLELDRDRTIAAALDETQPVVHVVAGGRFLALDVLQIIF